MSANRFVLFGALALASALGASGCGAAFDMQPPPDFVELDEDTSYDLRATNAQGVVISVRELDNDPEGSVTFWLDAIKNRMRTVRGYALVEEHDVRAQGGATGKQLRFGRDEGTQPYVYWITVFVTDNHIFVVEAGGKRDDFEHVRPQIERAIAAFDAG